MSLFMLSLEMELSLGGMSFMRSYTIGGLTLIWRLYWLLSIYDVFLFESHSLAFMSCWDAVGCSSNRRVMPDFL